MYKQNLHTHSTFDDGKNTPEETIKMALEKGFDSIGFSGHAYMYYSEKYSMSKLGTIEFKNEILRLKEKYNNIIDIYLGLEFDMFSDTPHDGYDYMLGSCHYIKIGDEFVGVDRPKDHYEKIIKEYFGSNGMGLVKEYYKQIAEYPKYAKIDILSHYDLITRNIEQANFFDYTSKEYMNYAIEALETLRKDIPFFEVNTGVIVKGYKSTPYPLLPIIKEMKRLDFGAIITSDCHDANYLDAYFDDARELLKSAGFNEKYILTKNGFTAVEL